MAKGDTVKDAQPGDSVRFRTPQGQERTGKVILKFATHVVVRQAKRNMPDVVDDVNFVSLRRMPGRKEQSDFVTRFM